MGKPATRAAEVVARMVQPENRCWSKILGRYCDGSAPADRGSVHAHAADRSNPELVDPLIGWIKDRRFDLVVLLVSLEDRNLDYWWSDYHFGPRVANALRASYRPERWVGRYLLYRPVR